MVDATSILLTGRGVAESLMTSVCTITRETEGALDPTTDLYSETEQTIYTGTCKVKFSSNRVSAREAEGQLRAAQQIQVHLPVLGSQQIDVGDIVTITADLDPELVGRQFRVSGEFAQTYATARRVPVESLT